VFKSYTLIVWSWLQEYNLLLLINIEEIELLCSSKVLIQDNLDGSLIFQVLKANKLLSIAFSILFNEFIVFKLILLNQLDKKYCLLFVINNSILFF
jgi:hypothetical protein